MSRHTRLHPRIEEQEPYSPHRLPVKVLIAADDILTLQTLESNVDSLGYEAVLALDDRAILHFMEQNDRPPMVILDSALPRMDTAAVCRRIRLSSDGAPPYIILISPGAPEGKRAFDPDSSPDDFISSPFTAGELRARISVGMRVIDLETDLRARLLDLNNAERRIKKLSGLLPICYHCKKIRDDTGYWNELEKYITDHSDAEFSHAICPACLSRYYPDVKDECP